MSSNKPLVSVVAPFYNEGEGVEVFYESMLRLSSSNQSVRFEFICVDDGSRDDTLARLKRVVTTDTRFRVLELSRNFGKESALTAGIDAAMGDAVVPIDADLQDPPELINDMIREWQQGADVVLARRSDRSVDHFLKRLTAALFYRFHNHMSSIKIPENVGDFRLMNRASIDALKRLPEQQRFMKGLFAWVGFRTVTLDYTRQERSVGNSKFSGWKLWNFALDGITSFSTAPLKIWSYIGLMLASLTLVYAAFITLRTLITGVDIPGYASLLVAVLFLGSVQLISIGILGEYIGRIYMESKNRPAYIVRQHHRPTGQNIDATGDNPATPSETSAS